jgi:hypothetical protein
MSKFVMVAGGCLALLVCSANQHQLTTENAVDAEKILTVDHYGLTFYESLVMSP